MFYRALSTVLGFLFPKPEVKGVGINVHSVKLPVDKLKAIDIAWVRIDLPENEWTDGKAKELREHYKDFGQLWIASHTWPNLERKARYLKSLGLSDLELFNEPKLLGITTKQYFEAFKSLKKVFKGRIYAPSLSTWTNEKFYLEELIKMGMRGFIKAVHFYWEGTPEETAEVWKRECPDAVCTEICWLESHNYRNRLGISSNAEAFLRAKKAFEGMTWCWYRAPDEGGEHDTGLFSRDDLWKFIYPNETYEEILASGGST